MAGVYQRQLPLAAVLGRFETAAVMRSARRSVYAVAHSMQEATALSPAMAGLGLGIALASAPGPVQAVLLAEALRDGGVRRGLRAMAGANLTFGALLVALALGLSFAPPTGTVLRLLQAAGGLLLLWLAADGLGLKRSTPSATEISATRVPPVARGVLAVILNPGAWLFLAIVATPLFASASRASGTPGALVAALMLVVGVALGDVSVVLLGGLGVRRAAEHVQLWVRRGLALILAALALWLLASSVFS